MIRKIRSRFLASAVIAVGIVLAALIAIISLCGYGMIVNRLDQKLSFGETAYIEGEKGAELREDPFRRKDNPLFWIAEYDAAGALLYITKADDAHEMAEIRKVARAAYLSRKAAGFYGGCRYLKKSMPDEGGTRILFLDATRSMTQFHDFLRIQILVVLVAFALSVVFMLRMSHWVVRPYVRAYESQRRFTANISHDLKTPLTVIRADADVLSGTIPDNRWLKDIQLQAGKMSELVEEMLQLSRMQEPESRQMWVDFPISDIVEEEAQMFVRVAEAGGRRFSYDVEPMLTYFGDAKGIRHLTGLLLGNAIKYSPREGEVALKLRKKGSNIILTVYNTVEHISRSELPKLTERFYRSDSARSHNDHSHGIGLAVADEIVRAHKGTLTLSTEDEKSFLATVRL